MCLFNKDNALYFFKLFKQKLFRLILNYCTSLKHFCQSSSIFVIFIIPRLFGPLKASEYAKTI